MLSGLWLVLYFLHHAEKLLIAHQRHPNIVQLYSVSTSANLNATVYIDGMSLEVATSFNVQRVICFPRAATLLSS